MPVNVGSLSSELLDRFLEDHQTEIEPLMAFEQWADVRDGIQAMSGDVYLWETPLGVPADGHRESKMGLGEPAPESNDDFGTISYKCEKYGRQRTIPNELLTELQSYEDVSNKLVRANVLEALFGFNKVELADMLLNNGTAANDRDLTEKAVSNPWDTASGTPLADIDDVVEQLRGGNLQAIVGWDVAQILSKDPDITGSDAGSGEEYTTFGGVVSFLRARGISQVIIDGSVAQDGQRNFTRSYKGTYDGVFYIGIQNNIIVPRFQRIIQKAWESEDTDSQKYKATMLACGRRAYKEHGYCFTGIKS